MVWFPEIWAWVISTFTAAGFSWSCFPGFLSLAETGQVQLRSIKALLTHCHLLQLVMFAVLQLHFCLFLQLSNSVQTMNTLLIARLEHGTPTMAGWATHCSPRHRAGMSSCPHCSGTLAPLAAEDVSLLGKALLSCV